MSTIYVSVPSYRDPETWHTLFSLFARSRHPERVRAVVCYQRVAGSDPEVHAEYEKLCADRSRESAASIAAAAAGRGGRIRVLGKRHEDARGPCQARKWIEDDYAPRLRQGDFVLLVDSHTMFSQDWDEYLRAEWARAGDRRAVLTSYPGVYDRADDAKHGESTATNDLGRFTFFKGFDGDGAPTYDSAPFRHQPSRPLPSICMHANFCFMPACAVRRVPYLQNVPLLFFGEEYLMAMRLWTHGYNFYAPSALPVRTLYDRSYRPVFWENTDRAQDAGRARMLDDIRRQLRAEYSSAGAGARSADARSFFKANALGQERTVQQFFDVCGVDMMRQTSTCGAGAGVAGSCGPRREEALQHEIYCKIGVSPGGS